LTSTDLAIAVMWVALFFLVSGPVHECAHAFTAWRLGDGTAKLFGRITLDPVTHFDPVGGGLLILSVAVSLFSNGAGGFGWAKPTPVNSYNLRGKYGDTLVAAAGPVSNLALAAAFAIGFRVMWGQGYFPTNDSVPDLLTLFFLIGVELNVFLGIFNLIPIAPLDGSHVLFDLVSPRTAHDLRIFMDQYGLLLLVGVVIFAARIITPIAAPIENFLLGVPFF
jgi:Zn-dependent protease